MTYATLVVALLGVGLPGAEGERLAFDNATAVRRGEWKVQRDLVETRGRLAVLPVTALDFELSAEVRFPGGEDGDQAWLRFRFADDHTHYALALRGGNCNDLFLFRFRPGGRDRLLALEPIPPPKPNVWHRVRVRMRGDRIEAFLGDSAVPVIDVIDSDPLPAGQLGFGGGSGWSACRRMTLKRLPPLPPLQGDTFAPDAIKINFEPEGSATPEGYRSGAPFAYSAQRGHGWIGSLPLPRERKVEDEPRLDTLCCVAHGLGEARFVCDVPAGEYLITLVGGDPSYPSSFEPYFQDESVPSESLDLPAGRFHALVRPVTVRDGQLRLTLRSRHPQGQAGGSYGYLVIERRESAPGKHAAAASRWRELAAKRSAKVRDQTRDRGRRRRAYRPQVVRASGEPRQEVSLCGDWLFLPDQERAEGVKPFDPAVSDEEWHVLPVPAFWQPIRWWIYGPNEGTSDNWVQSELDRCGKLTFDYARTKAGWYRRWIDLPEELRGRRLTLRSGAVSRLAQVWFNGEHIGGHTGMFAPFELDLTGAAKFGERNLLAVFVSGGKYQGEGSPDEVVGTAVTVEITRDMLNSLPHGMYGGAPGLWRPVSLEIGGFPRIDEVFVQPTLTGYTADISVSNTGEEGVVVEVEHEVRDAATGEVLVAPSVCSELPLLPHSTALTQARATGLQPKLWSPEEPNLYRLYVRLRAQAIAGETPAVPGTDVIDERVEPLGFRTFEVRGNRLHLNGKPYWLRGANHCPHGLRPNDAKLARTFLQLMHDGNTLNTRTHGTAFSEEWLNAADEIGIGVSMEGVWPWTMIGDSAVPSQELLDNWRQEWLGVMKATRNHPSILMWTLNNESYWYRDKDAERRKRKWRIASDMIRGMRGVDPTRPVVLDSGYVRRPDVYEKELRPNRFDDGDMDDCHRYYGWYAASPFHLYGGGWEGAFIGDRPAISQEFSQGYPNNDTGHPTRKYIDRHYVPQAWVGDWAYEDRPADVFLTRQAWLSKELAEVCRRDRDKVCGISHFAVCNWFANCWEPERIEPFPAYHEMRKALAPVLGSIELRRRHFFAGDGIRGRVCVVNDDLLRGDLADVEVHLRLIAPDGDVLGVCRVQVGAVPYYGNEWRQFELPITYNLGSPSARSGAGTGSGAGVSPAKAGGGRLDATLILEVWSADRLVSANDYPITVARRAWAGRMTPPARTPQEVSWALQHPSHGLVVAGDQAAQALVERRERFGQFVAAGGRAIVMNGGKALLELLPDVVAKVEGPREIVNVRDELHPAFDGVGPLDLSWFNPEETDDSDQPIIPYAALESYRLKAGARITILADAVRPHGYLKQPTDVQRHTTVVLFEVRRGKGRIIVSGMNTPAPGDPLAARLLSNLVGRTRGGPDTSAADGAAS